MICIFQRFILSLLLSLSQVNICVSTPLIMHLHILKNLSRTSRLLCKFCSNNHRQRLTYSQFSGNKKGNCSNEKDTEESFNHNLTATINKYEIFQDEADVILDVTEEGQKIRLEDVDTQQAYDPYIDISLTRRYKLNIREVRNNK